MISVVFKWIECACGWGCLLYWAVAGVGAGRRASKGEAPKRQTHCQAMMTLFWKRRAATTKRNVPMAKSARASIHRC